MALYTSSMLLSKEIAARPSVKKLPPNCA